MKDKGTPELQEKLPQINKREGLEYLHMCRTIDDEHLRAGRFYAACFKARYASNYPKSCLADFYITPGGPGQPSYHWQQMAEIHDAVTWHRYLTGGICEAALRARKPYHRIIEHVAGHDDWNLHNIADFCKVERKTASRYTVAAFETLCAVIEEEVGKWKRKQEKACRMSHDTVHLLQDQ